MPGSSGDVSNNFVGDPKFVSIANNDFHLTSGSPAIDGGANLGSPYDTDKDGNSRGSSWDIGAYEYGGVPGTTTTTISGCQDPDYNCNGCVDINELGAYIELWRNGQVSIDDVAIAVTWWTQGC